MHTWALKGKEDHKTHDWNIQAEGFKLFKRNRLNKKGGGVALYI